ncbi:hypothetical protein DFQ27_001582 [Actinomortierella ambigua]|uniref:FAS1 domain-containing protein n=1 Tax=Actinomortierella ambigua TaxID=1343610 RepID=A0A9P6QEM6_9FUNG|nr:hypothetical protein DFQ27_001582 [Actinomortierella ambigua]
MIPQQLLTCISAKKALATMVMLSLLPKCSTLPSQQACIQPATHFEQNSFALAPTSKAVEPATILDVLGQRPEFSELLKTIQKDKALTKLLADPNNQLMMFAPNNEAFDSLSDIQIPTRDLLMYHISRHPHNTTVLRAEPLVDSMYEADGLDGAAQYLRISPQHPSIPSATIPRPSFWRFDSEWIDQDEDQVDYGGNSNDHAGHRAPPAANELYVNRAKIIIPNLVTTSGSIVHGVNRIVQPPGDTILDEVLRHDLMFSTLTKAWTQTQVDVHVRDSKSITLFAAPDKAWKALPKKLKKWLFSNKGREHLKIFTMYSIGERTLYTPEIFNLTNDDGSKSPDYKEIAVQSMLKSPEYQLHVKGEMLRDDENDSLLFSEDLIQRVAEYLVDEVGLHPGDLARATLQELKMAAILNRGDANDGDGDDDDDGGKGGKHHYPHRDPNHRHHHNHKTHKHHKDHRHDGGDGDKKPAPGIERNEILVNKKAKIVHGYENWIAGNGVIHVIDQVLIPPKSEGCKGMSKTECAAWQHMWQLASADDDDEGEQEEEEDEVVVESYLDELLGGTGRALNMPWAESSKSCLFGNFEHCGLFHDAHNMLKFDNIDNNDDDGMEGNAELEGGWL